MRIDNKYTDSVKEFLSKQIVEVTTECDTLTKRDKKEIEKWLNNNWVYFAEDMDKIMGWVVREPISKTVMEIKSLYVVTDFRGAGVGKKLIEYATNQSDFAYICATRTKLTHGILSANGFKKIGLLSLKIETLLDYLKSRKIKSILSSFGNKTTFWFKNAN